MTRYAISDSIGAQLESTMRKKGCHKWKNDRNVMEGILWKLRTGSPWRDLPKKFCPWKTAYNRFNRWAAKGLWEVFFWVTRGNWYRMGIRRCAWKSDRFWNHWGWSPRFQNCEPTDRKSRGCREFYCWQRLWFRFYTRSGKSLWNEPSYSKKIQ